MTEDVLQVRSMCACPIDLPPLPFDCLSLHPDPVLCSVRHLSIYLEMIDPLSYLELSIFRFDKPIHPSTPVIVLAPRANSFRLLTDQTVHG